MQNSTIYSNTAQFNWGGGLSNVQVLTAANVTLYGNIAPSARNLYSAPAASADLTNLLVARRGTGANCLLDGTVSGSNNFANDATCGGTFVNRTLTQINLGPVEGTPAYWPLLSGSLAIDAGTATCPSPDQRGTARPQGAACDVGAYEFVPGTAAAALTLAKTVSPAAAAPGQVITFTLAFTNTGNAAAAGLVLTDTVPAGLTNPGFAASGVTATARPGSPYIWDLSDLAPGASARLTLTATLADTLTAGQAITNTASLSTQTAEVNRADNTSTAAVGVACVPASVVTSTADSGPGSLHLAAANTCADGTITFSLATPATITLTSGEISLARSLTLTGPGAGLLTVSGNAASRVFNVAAGVRVQIAGLTLRQGLASGPACPAACGGAVLNAGSLTLTSVVLADSAARDGGGLYNTGALTLTGSTLLRNTALNAGAGLHNTGSLVLRTSSLLSNTASVAAGGLALFGALTAQDATFAFNAAPAAGNIAVEAGSTASLSNVLLTRGSAGANCLIVGGFAAANSLADDASCAAIAQTAPAALNLGPVTGAPAVLTLLPGSSAVDAGPATCLALDQRGVSRPLGLACDVGAYELIPIFQASLRLTKSVTPAAAAPGQVVTFTLAFTNTGSAAAAGLVLTDTLPAGLINPSFAASGVTATARPGSPYVWDLSDLAPGASARLTLTATLAANLTIGQAVINTATLRTQTPESDLTDNTASATVSATCSLTPVVTTTADSGPGSLRQLVADLCPGGTITFGLTTPATITLTSGQLTLGKNLTVSGPGANLLTLRGNGSTRLVNVPAGVRVQIAGLTLRQGTLSGTTCPASCGGGVLNAGSLTLAGVTLADNAAFEGGGLYNTGTVTLTASLVTHNNATSNIDGEGGGGLRNLGLLVFTGSTLAGNTAVQDAGGLLNSGQAVLQHSTFSGNAAPYFAGAVRNSAEGALTIYRCTFTGNSSGLGGAVANFGVLAATDSALIDNLVTYVFGTKSYGTGGGFGNQEGTATFTNVTISNNQVNGRDDNGGGGVAVHGGVVSFLNSTISGNSTTSRGGPKGLGGAGGVAHLGGVTRLENTIVAGNTSAAGKPDLSGTLTSDGYNLIGASNGGAGFTNGVNHDQVGSVAAPLDARLIAPGVFGGETPTQPLLASSPAIDHANPATCPAQDQRGVARLGQCDIGAYEYSPGSGLLQLYLPLVQRGP
ncbi:MAG: DUF11 domain-containing protein [Anaerolineales bacterium]|nr:DUF11 domain-containing protein [Anaerolineales bacterium]